MGKVTSKALSQCLGILLVKVGKNRPVPASGLHFLYIDAVFSYMAKKRNSRFNPLPFVWGIPEIRTPLGYGVLELSPESYILIIRNLGRPVSEEMLLYIIEQAHILVRRITILLQDIIAEAM